MHQCESTLDEIDGGREICDAIDVCNEFTDFAIENGLVTDLLVNGQDGSPQLTVGDSAVESGA